MATTPSLKSGRSPASSTSSSLPAQEAPDLADSINADTLVEHLLAAKRSLSSMTSVQRANEIATSARQAHEDAVVLSATSDYLRRAISDQATLLLRVKKALVRTYEYGKRDFKHLIKTMDTTDGNMQRAADKLRQTIVQSAFRPAGEEPKNLLDFIDESSAHSIVEDLKASVKELQSIQGSFDSDLLRFQNDIQRLKKIIMASPASVSASSSRDQPIPDILTSLAEHSRAMAEHLTALTKHFDLCVTAVRMTDGGAALARRKAAEVSQSQEGDSVSISGMIAEQESQMSDLEPVTSQDRTDIISVVIQDSAEVEDVVEEIRARLAAMENDFSSLDRQTGEIRTAYFSTLEAFRVLDDIGGKISIYVGAEAEFLQRWEDEKAIVHTKLDEMNHWKDFYDSYADAYDNLILEVERRRLVEEKIQAIWRKAREGVDKLLDGDRKERDNFLQEVGELLPQDLWGGMKSDVTRWEVRPVQQSDSADDGQKSCIPALARSVVEAARGRLGGTTKAG